MRTLLLPLLSLAIPLATRAETPASEPPSQATVLPILIHAASRALPESSQSFCSGVADGGTIGDYLALLVAHGALAPEPETTASLALSYVEGARDLEVFPDQFVADADQHWVCTLAAGSVYRFSGDPWNYELRFLLRKRDLRLDRRRMWCPGSP